MKKKQNRIDRRKFLKAVGAAGVAPAFARVTTAFAAAKATAGTNDSEAIDPNTTQKTPKPKLPMRKLGKTGIKAPCLSLGTMFNVVEKQIVLRRALQLGVTYWDTAHNYIGGNSELGIGKFLSKNPQIRKELLIATKASGAKTVADVEKRLQTSLKRMNTGYIDVYYGVHALSNPAQLTDELKQWAENAKKRKLIRFFGFTTHKNMAQHLAAAAKLDWIDVIMTTYNFRVMQDPELQAAVEACNKAGIGLIAMKTTGLQSWYRQKVETEEDKKLIDHFVQRGFSTTQATIKAVLGDKRISSACVGMGNVAHLTSNVAAARDKTKLSKADMNVLTEYAQATCSGYCAGCAHICDSALPDAPYVSNIMRYLMYYNSYGEPDRARELFAKIPGKVRNKLLSTDYSLAEARCPQHIPIGELIAEAVSKLA